MQANLQVGFSCKNLKPALYFTATAKCLRYKTCPSMNQSIQGISLSKLFYSGRLLEHTTETVKKGKLQLRPLEVAKGTTHTVQVSIHQKDLVATHYHQEK